MSSALLASSPRTWKHGSAPNTGHSTPRMTMAFSRALWTDSPWMRVLFPPQAMGAAQAQAAAVRSSRATRRACSPGHGHVASRSFAAQPAPITRSRSRTLSLVLTCGVLLGGAACHLALPERRSSTLNRHTFVPYIVVAHEAVSPSSAILTVEPQTSEPAPPYVQPPCSSAPATGSWRYPLWSVEFKQPEVQIARHYTPLPPRCGDRPADGRLRFYIRALDGGEMSAYMRRLAVGHTVWLRGPHVGFDVLRRLGASRHLIFIAGGTGLVPALQVARAVLDDCEQTTMNLLWAVRKTAEVHGGLAAAGTPWWKWWARRMPLNLELGLIDPSPIVMDLVRMKATYGNRLNIRVAIDEEGNTFREQDIEDILRLPPSAPRNQSSTAQGCAHHDQQLHAAASEFQNALEAACLCHSFGRSRPGKNLFIVSGPDGFVSHYAGPKVWVNGTLAQGPVAGLADRMQRRFPGLLDDWLVLKL